MNGILIVDKKEGITSFDVIRDVRKKYNEKKVGHIGTLDPLASGVLPVLIGKTTKLSDLLMEHDKDYTAKIILGAKTDTGDREGRAIEKKEVKEEVLTKENVESVLKSFLGETFQTPPMYSALKVNGKKLYELARDGKTIEREKRKICISNIELVKINKFSKAGYINKIKNNNIENDYNTIKDNTNATTKEEPENNINNIKSEENIINNIKESEIFEIEYKVTCSKGTYIRVLSENIAEKLETIGYMSYLRRTRVGNFKIEDAGKFIDMENIISNIPEIEIENQDLNKLINGVKIKVDLSDGLCKIYSNKNFLGFGEVNNSYLKRKILI